MATPFVPFFVLVCHVLQTLDRDDLGLIQQFVDSLEGLRGASKAADKLYRLFQAMCEVASVYVSGFYEGQLQQGFAGDFDLYLNQLGLIAPGWGSTENPMVDMAEWMVDNRPIFE